MDNMDGMDRHGRTGTDKTYKRIEAVRATIKILRFLAAQRSPAAGTEVAEACGLPHGTVMCHLATLEDDGMVRQVGGAWELGLGMSLLWARYRSWTQAAIEQLQGEMRQLEIVD